MSSWSQLTAEFGLRRPAYGSLGRVYATALGAGTGIAVVLGLLTEGRVPAGSMTFASLALLQPVVEELLFRGFLQGRLSRTRMGSRSMAGISNANLVTTAVFVLIHFANRPPLWALGVIFPSLLFGYFRDRSGSVWPALFLHVVFNSAFFVT
jgi:membrane protease YdiL (CAAX protease family)